MAPMVLVLFSFLQFSARFCHKPSKNHFFMGYLCSIFIKYLQCGEKKNVFYLFLLKTHFSNATLVKSSPPKKRKEKK